MIPARRILSPSRLSGKKAGERGNIGIHARTLPGYHCMVGWRTFSPRMGTLFHRRQIDAARLAALHAARGTRLVSYSPSRSDFLAKGYVVMLWAIVAVLVVVWLLGSVAHVAGALIHLLLVIAVIVLIAQLVSGRRRV